VSLTGRPNVGKSTFVNAVLGRKVSIVTQKPQTTRNRIIGIKTLADAQIVFVDTPGIHTPRHGLGAHMVKEAKAAIGDVDLVLFMVEPEEPSREDLNIIRMLKNVRKPVFLLVNKTDRVRKTDILPVIDLYRDRYHFNEIVPVSALKGDGLDIVLERIKQCLGPGPQYYPDDLYTDSVERFMVAEIIREKIMKVTNEEVPHSVAVEVAVWDESREGLISISASIYVEKGGQKGIIIGRQGAKLKDIGIAARRDIQRLLGTKVFLELFVKVRRNWRSDKAILMDMGFK
jgi:GTP-binding protein Era